MPGIPVPMPVFGDWLAESAMADKGLLLMFFMVFIALSWLIICRYLLPTALPIMANGLFWIWAVTGIGLIAAYLAVGVH